MKLLLDQGLPRSAAKLLREEGIDTVHVSIVGWVERSATHRRDEAGANVMGSAALHPSYGLAEDAIQETVWVG